MKFAFPQKIRGGYLAAFGLLLFSYLLTITSIIQLREQNQWLSHTREVINKVQGMLSYLKDAEVGFRGYALMKDEKFLLPYYNSRQKVDSLYKSVETLTNDNPLEHERIGMLGNMIDRKFSIIQDQLEALRDAHLEINDAVRSKALESKALMDSIRFVTGLMENRENELLAQRTNKVNSSSKILFAIIVVSFGISILLIVYSLITFNIENKEKRIAKKQAKEYHDQLEKRINELNIANRELIELRSLEKFTSTGRIARVIAHEVRNPLTNIDLSAGQLASDDLNSEDKKMFLDIIARNSRKINQLINELLQATRFSELKYEKTDINELLDETLNDSMDRAQLNHVKIEKNYTQAIPSVKVDKMRIKIALTNIIVNAMESMQSENGLLMVETHINNDQCVISIRDNGKGMDDETLSKIFDPYFTSKTKGNGLGLTNTQNIILNHKGKIKAVSELGKGSEFIIYLNITEN